MPWVSRSHLEHLDRELASARIFADTFKQCFDIIDAKYTALVATVVHMKQEGFVAQPDPDEFIPQPQSVDETDEERALEELHG